LIPQDYIADGTLVAWKKEQPLPYSELEMRLKRPVEDLFIGEDVDTLLWLFDLFWCNGDTLLDLPLNRRRRELDTFSVNLRLRISPVQKVDSTDKLPSLLRDSQNRGNGGLIIKDATKRYDPLSLKPSWYSLK
jgi:DNA ligase-1